MRYSRHAHNWESPRAYSPAVTVGEWVHVSGHVPVDADGRTVGSDGATQAAQALGNVLRTLESAGATSDDVVATTVYLTDIADMDAVDGAYRTVFTGRSFPARTTVEVSRLGRSDFRVEISAIAHVAPDRRPEP